jgi:hypothetical protein
MSQDSSVMNYESEVLPLLNIEQNPLYVMVYSDREEVHL